MDGLFGLGVIPKCEYNGIINVINRQTRFIDCEIYGCHPHATECVVGWLVLELLPSVVADLPLTFGGQRLSK